MNNNAVAISNDKIMQVNSSDLNGDAADSLRESSYPTVIVFFCEERFAVEYISREYICDSISRENEQGYFVWRQKCSLKTEMHLRSVKILFTFIDKHDEHNFNSDRIQLCKVCLLLIHLLRG